MLEIIRLLLGLSATTLIGYSILKFILYKERRPFFEELALSYGIGMGIIALAFILFYFFNLKLTLNNILLPGLVIFFLSLFIKRAALEIKPQSEYEQSLFDRFLIFGITLEVILSFFRALIKPIESFDSIAIYAIRAKVFYQADGIPKDFFAKITNAFPNSGHPPMVPLAEAWVYTFLGRSNDFLVKIIFPLYLVALLVIFYFALREFFDRRNSLLFTFLLATIPQFNRFSSIGYADFLLTFYFTAAFLYLFHWMKHRKIQYLLLSALLMAFSCWTKMEGWALFLSVVLVTSVFVAINFKQDKKILVKLGIFSLLVLLVALPWIILVSATHLESDVFQFSSFGFNRFISSMSNFDRCPRIIYEFQKQFFGPKKWNIIWLLFLALFAINLKDVFRGDIKYLTTLLILIMVGYGYSYLLIPLKEGVSINWNIGSTLSRLFIHFTPLCVFWLASLCKKKEYL